METSAPSGELEKPMLCLLPLKMEQQEATKKELKMIQATGDLDIVNDFSSYGFVIELVMIFVKSARLLL